MSERKIQHASQAGSRRLVSGKARFSPEQRILVRRQETIGAGLQQCLSGTVRQPLPDDMLELMGRLDDRALRAKKEDDSE